MSLCSKNRQLLFIVALVISVLHGCSSFQKDGAPGGRLNPAEIKLITAKYEPTSRGGNSNPYTVLGKTYQLLPTNQGYREKGVASWYGTKFHGRKTANGEVYDMRALSAAHRSLPIPTYLRVTNLSNQRSVVVRVNDRGPFHSERVIDLSYGAATMLGFVDNGTAPVLLESIDFPQAADRSNKATVSGRNHYLQVGAFSRKPSADALKLRIESLLDSPVEIKRNENGNDALYRVYVGPFVQLDLMAQVKEQLHTHGIQQSYRISGPQ